MVHFQIHGIQQASNFRHDKSLNCKKEIKMDLTKKMIFSCALSIGLLINSVSLLAINPNNPVSRVTVNGFGVILWEEDIGTTRIIRGTFNNGAGSPFVGATTLSDVTKYSFSPKVLSAQNLQVVASWIQIDTGTGLRSLWATSLVSQNTWLPAQMISGANDDVLPDYTLQLSEITGIFPTMCAFSWRCVEAGQVKIKLRKAAYPVTVANLQAPIQLSP